MCQKLRTIP